MSAEAKLTPWFPHGTKPARDGVYEVVFVDTPGFARYFKKPPNDSTGNHWSSLVFSPREAARMPPGGSIEPRWRGLAENPSPGAAPDQEAHE